jgi:hypothetical protein
MENIKVVNLKKIGNSKDGFLSYFEAEKNFGFVIKRVYYLYDVNTELNRGNHAHKLLKQIMFCPHGKIKINIDNGFKKQSYTLDKPNKVLFFKKGYWREISYVKSNSILIVAASDFYTEDDYIRDYNSYLKFVKEGGYK